MRDGLMNDCDVAKMCAHVNWQAWCLQMFSRMRQMIRTLIWPKDHLLCWYYVTLKLQTLLSVVTKDYELPCWNVQSQNVWRAHQNIKIWFHIATLTSEAHVKYFLRQITNIFPVCHKTQWLGAEDIIENIVTMWRILTGAVPSNNIRHHNIIMDNR